MKSVTQFLASAMLGLLFTTPVLAGDSVRIESPDSQATLVELYTSEGCSSCPPADRWLSGLKNDPRLWRDLVPVAFHVDYWNYLGWRDRFSDATYSQRQRDYAYKGLVRTVYTPGFIVNGREWRGWFRRQDLQPSNNAHAGKLTAVLDGDVLKIEYQPDKPIGKPLTVHTALLGFDLSTRVKAGENHGHTLNHDFVVLGYETESLKTEGGIQQVKTILPRASSDAPRRALAVWVTHADNPRPLQAAGGWIK
ncbi:MAG: DUF1223 domain-containing protein [Chromatiales bacterium]|nr:DUF1223 domain-containing protein [Chromatiales bacterium]